MTLISAMSYDKPNFYGKLLLISIIFTIFASTNRKLLIMPMAKQIDILCSESSLYSAWSIVKAKPSRKRSQ